MHTFQGFIWVYFKFLFLFEYYVLCIGIGLGRVDPGLGQVGPSQCTLALDPIRAGPAHQNAGPTLARLGSGQLGLAMPVDSVHTVTNSILQTIFLQVRTSLKV